MAVSNIPVGVDIIEIKDIEQAISSWQDSFLNHVYTKAELEVCNNDTARLATRFAAKEAVMKALKGGRDKGISWKDIEILSDSDGIPYIQLHGQALRKSRELGDSEFFVTMSHSKDYAIAFVIGNSV